jgi:hypothetical protein
MNPAQLLVAVGEMGFSSRMAINAIEELRKEILKRGQPTALEIRSLRVAHSHNRRSLKNAKLILEGLNQGSEQIQEELAKILKAEGDLEVFETWSRSCSEEDL